MCKIDTWISKTGTKIPCQKTKRDKVNIARGKHMVRFEDRYVSFNPPNEFFQTSFILKGYHSNENGSHARAYCEHFIFMARSNDNESTQRQASSTNLSWSQSSNSIFVR